LPKNPGAELELTEVMLSDNEGPHRLFVDQSILESKEDSNTDKNKAVKKHFKKKESSII
jgi:hypothetical protein